MMLITSVWQFNPIAANFLNLSKYKDAQESDCSVVIKENAKNC